jgi:hypothetical protein
LTNLDEIRKPEELVEFFGGFRHNFRYPSSLTTEGIDLTLDKYTNYSKLPRVAFPTKEEVLISKECSCYDMAFISYHILTELGYKCDILHFGLTPKDSSSLSILSCRHSMCRYWVYTRWYALQGFLYKLPVSLLGPFLSMEDFLASMASTVSKILSRPTGITFLDVWNFESDYLPTLITRLYPTYVPTSKLDYW